jgi:hypothetical protein
MWTAGVKGLESLEAIAWSAAQRLTESYQLALRPDWQWFEPRMTYANAVLPHALFIAARRWPRQEFRHVAEASFAFLNQATTAEDVFSPIGNEGWYHREDEKAMYDQQPVEAVTMAESALAALELTGDDRYKTCFRRARDWFHGKNAARLPLADIHRGACCDGLHADGVNRNQGAESTLAYLTTELLAVGVESGFGGDRASMAASA